MEVLRKYGVETKILFPLIDEGAQDFEATPVTHASGDTQISKDEAAFANTSNAFAHEGNGVYSITLTATEMEAARIVVTVIDQGSKEWEDQAIIISTYGDASAQHAFDLDAALTNDDVYTCKLMVVDDDVNNTDRYIAVWFKNGAFVAPDGTPNAKLWVFEHDGSDLVGTSGSPVTMSEIGSTDTFYWAEVTASERLVDGRGNVARVQADIDGSQRTWYQTIGRDSA